MAVNVATAYLTIVPKFDRSIRDAVTSQLGGSTMAKAGRSAGKSLGTSVTSGFGKATSGIKSVLGNALATGASIVAVSGIASGLGDYASAAMQAADSTQKFKSTLTFAGLGGDQIAALSESTRKYADDTVYSLSDIQNITAQLAANSVPNYDKLAEAAGNLNAVAGGNAETFKNVGMVLTQTAGQGKLTTENWNQLADAIPGASGKIQRALSDMGAYTGNFREAMEEGEISAEEFNQALMNLGFQDAAVEAAKSTSTFEGAFGQLEAAIQGGLGDILTTVQPGVTGLVNAVTGWVEPTLGGVNDALSTFVSNFQSNGAAQALSDVAAGLGQAVSDIGAAVGGIAGELLGIPEGTDPAVAAAEALKSALDAAKPVVEAFGDAAAWLKDNASQAAPVVAGLAFAFAGFRVVQGVAGFIGSFKIALGGIQSVAGPATSAIGNVGGAASMSAPQILALGGAIALVGAGVLLASAGLMLLAQSAIQIAAAGPGAAVAMVAMVAAIAGLAAGAAVLAPALSAGAVGLVAFGAAVALVGVGVLAASAGIALIAGQLPTISAYGASAAAGMAALGAASLALGAGVLVAGAGLVVFGAGATVAGAALVVLSAALLPISGAVTVAAGALGLLAGAMEALAGGVTTAADGVSKMGKAFPKIASSAPGAATGLGTFATAAGLASGAVSSAAEPMASFGTAIGATASAVVTAAAGIAMLASGTAVVASSTPAAASGLSALAAAASQASGPLASAAPSLAAAASTAAASAAGFAVAAAGAQAMASGMAVAMAAVLALVAAASTVPAVMEAGRAAFGTFAESARTAAQDATSAISAACQRMRSEVSSLQLRLPRIQVGPLPHFSMRGGFNPRTGAVPSVSVSWYAKGGVFDGASVIGVGERGPEAVVPLSSRRIAPFAEAIAEAGGAGTVNNVSLTLDGVSYNGRSEVEEIVMRLLYLLHREGVM